MKNYNNLNESKSVAKNRATPFDIERAYRKEFFEMNAARYAGIRNGILHKNKK